MQYVNDDMDEVFRRAAENYPLDTSGADWNKVMAAMQTKDELKDQRNKKRRFLWLFMLVPAALVGSYFILQQPDTNHKTKSEIASDPSTDKKTIETPVKSTITNGDLPSSTASTTQQGVTTNAFVAVPSLHQMGVVREKVHSKNDASQYASRSSSPIGSSSSVSKGKNVLTSNGEGAIASVQVPAETRNFFLPHVAHQPFGRVASAVHISASEKYIAKDAPVKSTPAEKPKRFYAGALVGIDATTIKMQQVKNAGNDFGLLAGYEINKKWSLELGFLLDKKYYFTDGKYFDDSKIYNMPPNSWILEVTGNCRMIELPLVAKYNFSPSPRSTAFFTAGLSSYIMKKENYSYLYYYSVSNSSMTHQKSYANSSKNLFSVIQLSGGYSHRIGKEGNFRIEPYLKMPLTGVGFGSLPLMSTGMHVLYTHRLF